MTTASAVPIACPAIAPLIPRPAISSRTTTAISVNSGFAVSTAM